VESGGPSVGKVRECDVESQHLQDCSPACVDLGLMGWPPRASIERTDRMLVYGPSKTMSLCNHLAEPSLSYSKAVMREEE
jgi:hypothetical protein